MAGNIGVELYLAIGKMKPVSPNFNPPTLNQPISPIRLILPTLNQPIFAYSILLPNIISANISGHMVYNSIHSKCIMFLGLEKMTWSSKEGHNRQSLLYIYK